MTTKGRVETTEVLALDLARRMADLGVGWFVHTDVATDGAMQGPNLPAQQAMAAAVSDCRLIASGGVTNNQDLLNLNRLAEEYPNIEGVIIGRALYEKSINLKDAIEACS